MRKIVLFFVCVSLFVLAACSQSGQIQEETGREETGQQDMGQQQHETAPELPTPKFAFSEFPRIDGSTANIPLMIKVICETTGISEGEAEANVFVSTTSKAYDALLCGDADLLLAYEPPGASNIIKNFDNMEFVPIGKDALVFIANEGNPVNDLSTEQLREIYSGNIANWKEVGGGDQKIEAYQREEGSGSQTLFLRLLMGSTMPMDAPVEFFPGQMSELIDRIASYNIYDANALGFSVYYYAKNMYMLPGLKLLSVDGVMPSNETIADGSYPFLNDFYAVIRTDSATDSPERQIVEWLQSPGGKRCITDAGYVAVK